MVVAIFVPHFKEEETEVQKGSINNLPKFTQLIRGKANIQSQTLVTQSSLLMYCTQMLVIAYGIKPRVRKSEEKKTSLFVGV